MHSQEHYHALNKYVSPVPSYFTAGNQYREKNEVVQHLTKKRLSNLSNIVVKDNVEHLEWLLRVLSQTETSIVRKAQSKINESITGSVLANYFKAYGNNLSTHKLQEAFNVYNHPSICLHSLLHDVCKYLYAKKTSILNNDRLATLMLRAIVDYGVASKVKTACVGNAAFSISVGCVILSRSTDRMLGQKTVELDIKLNDAISECKKDGTSNKQQSDNSDKNKKDDTHDADVETDSTEVNSQKNYDSNQTNDHIQQTFNRVQQWANKNVVNALDKVAELAKAVGCTAGTCDDAKSALLQLTMDDANYLSDWDSSHIIKNLTHVLGRLGGSISEAYSMWNIGEPDTADVTQGDDISQLLSSEYTMLASGMNNSVGKYQFYAKLQDAALMQLQKSSEADSGYGPVIIMRDISGSVLDTLIVIDKVQVRLNTVLLALTKLLVDDAKRNDQPVLVVPFASNVLDSAVYNSTEFSKGTQTAYINSLFCKPGGGTQISEAFKYVSELFKNETNALDYKAADIIILTDGELDVACLKNIDDMLNRVGKNNFPFGLRVFCLCILDESRKFYNTLEKNPELCKRIFDSLVITTPDKLTNGISQLYTSIVNHAFYRNIDVG